MRHEKTIELLIFLILALCSGVRAQYCKDGGNYTAFVHEGEFDGVNPADKGLKVCQCVRDTLEKSGQIKNTEFDCVESKDLEQIRYTYAKDDGTPSQFSQCMDGSRKVNPANSTEDAKICKIIAGSSVSAEKSVARRTKRAIRVRCFFVFSFKCCFKIRLLFRCVFW